MPVLRILSSRSRTITAPASGGGGGGGPGTSLTQLVISNENTSLTQGGNFITNMFGQAFAAGHIVSGDWPQFQLADGTVLEANIMSPVYWNDGSMRFASCLLRVPTAISAVSRTFTASGGTVTLANQTGLTTGDACILHSTVRLPMGLYPTESYYVRLGAANTATFHPTQTDAINNTNAVTVTGSGSGTHHLQPALVVTVKTSGAAPTSAVVSTDTVLSNSNLKVVASAAIGNSGWSGVMTSELSAGIAAGGVNYTEFGNGPCGRIFRAYAPFNNGSNHAHAGVFHYVQALQTSAGALYGIRYFPAIYNGFIDVSSTSIETLACDYLVAQNSAVTVADPGTGLLVHAFHIVSGAICSVSSTFRLAVGSSSGLSDEPTHQPVALSAVGGTLPTELSVGKIYWLRQYGINFGGSQFRLFNTAKDCYNQTNAISCATSGTGSFYIEPRPQIQFYSAGKPVVNSDARYIFVSGAAGVGSETVTRVTQNRKYLLGSKVLPPYIFDTQMQSVVACVQNRSFALETMDDIQYGDQTGPTESIGQIMAQEYRHILLNQHDRTMRTYSATQHHRTWALLRSTTRNWLNTTEVSTSALGSAMPQWSFRPSNPAANNLVQAPSDYTTTFGAYTWDHRPGIQGYAYLTFGEPQMVDMMVNCAMAGLGHIYGGAGTSFRTQVVAGSTYYNTQQSEMYERNVGWRYRDFAHILMFAPRLWNRADWPSVAAYYFRNEMAFVSAFHATQHSSFTSTNNFPVIFGDAGYLYSPWGRGFLNGALAQALIAASISGIQEDLERNYRMVKSIYNQWGPHYIDAFFTMFTASPVSISSWDQVGAAGAISSITWNSATDVVSVGADSSVWGPMYNGANFINWGHKGEIAGVSNGQNYYIGNYNSTTRSFNLFDSSTLTSMIDLTDSGAITDPTGLAGNRLNSDGLFGSPSKNETALYTNVVYYIKYMQAISISIDASMVSAFMSLYGAPPTYGVNPTYAFQPSYIYT